MKIAVISDIHGFSLALDAVLADIDLVAGIDRIVAAGDLCETGPDPAGVVRRLIDRDITCIRGNTDRDLVSGVRGSSSSRWTMEKLGHEGLAFLRDLPFETRISPPGGRTPADDLLVVHANPFDEDRHIAPWLSDDEVRNLVGDTTAAVIAFGHIHVPYIRELDGRKLIDVSAVGNPKDEDLRSKWGLFSWDEFSRIWSIELRYVNYQLDETKAQIRQSGMPKSEKVIRKLAHASYREMPR